jgi:two-component sensor histidine kinase
VTDPTPPSAQARARAREALGVEWCNRERATAGENDECTCRYCVETRRVAQALATVAAEARAEADRLERVVRDQQERLAHLERAHDRLLADFAERGQVNVRLNRENQRLRQRAPAPEDG